MSSPPRARHASTVKRGIYSGYLKNPSAMFQKASAILPWHSPSPPTVRLMKDSVFLDATRCGDAHITIKKAGGESISVRLLFISNPILPLLIRHVLWHPLSVMQLHRCVVRLLKSSGTAASQ